MKWYGYVGYFLAGGFLANAVPHLVMGVTGWGFQTPFGNPSSALVNALWGFANLAVGWAILTGLGGLGWGFNRRVGAAALGFLAMSLFLAAYFG